VGQIPLEDRTCVGWVQERGEEPPQAALVSLRPVR
jgi:hypothetical protein